jgi:hypothetical protein
MGRLQSLDIGGHFRSFLKISRSGGELLLAFEDGQVAVDGGDVLRVFG